MMSQLSLNYKARKKLTTVLQTDLTKTSAGLDILIFLLYCLQTNFVLSFVTSRFIFVTSARHCGQTQIPLYPLLVEVLVLKQYLVLVIKVLPLSRTRVILVSPRKETPLWQTWMNSF